MTKALRILGWVLASLAMTGCSVDEIIEDILSESLPPNTEYELTETCSYFMGPAVALFSVVSMPPEEDFLNHTPLGAWTRSASLSEYAASDSYRGVGIGGTVLDGKQCLRDRTEDANDILFGARTGLFYRSEDRRTVAVILDEPRGFGVLFIQAP